ncbi:MAG TPA: hypothetical protein VMU80_06920 [Bryobacteraceae bacterium]|nr:hypothetical protein [Bryobacteraceae bacterium]
MPHRDARFSTAAVLATATAILLAVPGLSQTPPCQLPAGSPSPVNQSPSNCSDFFNCFAGSAYETPINSSLGADSGDLNSTYFELYYSIYNLQTWMASGTSTGSGLPYCPVELVMVGTFPNARYFSVTVDDMHYAAAEHLADIAMDTAEPKSGSYTNPFLPGNQYQAGQAYIAPISLGWVPQPGAAGTVTACQIAPSEQDNLLDATQRHFSMDWNTIAQGASGQDVPSGAHVVDLPQHTLPAAQGDNGSDTAGSILVRSYLTPPYSCNGAPGSVNCTPPPCPAGSCTAANGVTNQYFMVRDAYTGCAYRASYVQQYMLAGPYVGGTGGASSSNAIISTTNYSNGSNGNLWLDANMQGAHVSYANVTPQACYANGGQDPDLAQGDYSGPPTFSNRVAWTRSSEYRGSPGPDDSYIGGSISSADLESLVQTNGSAQCLGSDNYPSTDGCVIRMRFQLPKMQSSPGTPTPPCLSPYDCTLWSGAQMRYMSLTFWYQSDPPSSPGQYYIADVDGTNPAAQDNPVSMVSLADTAFATTTDGSGNQFVTLLVNVGANLPSWLQQTSTSAGAGATQGVQPVQPPGANPGTFLPYYSVWTVNGYTVLDLTQFANAGFSTGNALLITLRNTMAAPTFACAGSAVPYSTAEYTNVDSAGGGLMGPYVPLVDYVDPSNGNYLPQSGAPIPQLPSAASCGVLTNNSGSIFPSLNNPTLNGTGTPPTNWPQLYWPGWASNSTTTYLLNCTQASEPAAHIYYVASQRVTEAVGQNCATLPNNCTKIIPESPQENWELSGTYQFQPPQPITIVGADFGYLPVLPQMMASCNSCSNYLRIQNDDNSGLGKAWDTDNGAECQVEILNWSDTSITFMANLPIDAINASVEPLGPLYDASPITLTPQPITQQGGGNQFSCPIMYNANNGKADDLTFYVTNPQSGVTHHTASIAVQPYTASPN